MMTGYMGEITKGDAFILNFGTESEQLIRIDKVEPDDDVCCKVRPVGWITWITEFDFRRRATPVSVQQKGGNIQPCSFCGATNEASPGRVLEHDNGAAICADCVAAAVLSLADHACGTRVVARVSEESKDQA